VHTTGTAGGYDFTRERGGTSKRGRKREKKKIYKRKRERKKVRGRKR